MKRILLIGYHFYPETSAHTYQTEGLVNGFCKSGYSVDLIVPDFFSTEERKKFIAKRGLTNLTIHSIKPSGRFARLLGLDKKYGSAYAFAVARYVKKMKLHTNTELMVTTALPFSCHLAGLFIKRANKNIRWIADYGDPYSFNRILYGPLKFWHIFNLWLFRRKYGIAMEKKAVRKMHKITIPLEAAKEAYYKVGATEEQIEVIPLLFEYTPEACEYPHIDESKLNILYAGAFYQNARSPLEFFAAYKKLTEEGKAMAFHFFGNSEALNQYLAQAGMEDKAKYNIYANGVMPRNKLLHIMQKMDLLLNINNIYKEQMPSKLIDYVNSGIRVLNVGDALFDEFDNAQNNQYNIYQVLSKISKNGRMANYGKSAEHFNYDNNLKRYVSLLEE